MPLLSRGDDIQSKNLIKIGALIIILIFILGILREVSPYIFKPEPSVIDDEIQIEEVASGLGTPTCIFWASEEWLLVCDTNSQSILALELSDGIFSEPRTIISNLNNPMECYYGRI